ncbi:MAG: hypothetical protein MJ231_03505 [bacterium]|nr:hypothetical protein [bacterium]
MNNAINKIGFRGLVPLKDCKGPTLKLTSEDMKRIRKIQDEITEYEIALYDLDKRYGNKKLRTMTENFYYGTLDHINRAIDILKKEIRQIKIDRITQQRANFNKLI